MILTRVITKYHYTQYPDVNDILPIRVIHQTLFPTYDQTLHRVITSLPENELYILKVEESELFWCNGYRYLTKKGVSSKS